MNFVVGLQRSGTSFTAHLLNASGKIDCLHENLIALTCYQLFKAAQAYHEKRLDASSMKDLIRRYRQRPTIGIDSNFILTFMLPVLIEEYPQAKFLHLTRNPQDTMRSYFNEFDLYGNIFSQKQFQLEFMNWCVAQNRPWQYVFVKESHEFSPRLEIQGWDGLSRFEKICHYWVEGQRLILEHVSRRPGYLRLPLERLVADPSVAAQAMKFFDLPVPDTEKLKRVLDSRVNSSASGPLWAEIRRIKSSLGMETLGKPHEWPSHYREAFLRICGDMASRLGYELDLAAVDSRSAVG